MHPLSPSQQYHIISLLEAGHSACHIASITGLHNSTITRHCRKPHPYLPKSSGGNPPKCSDINICHAVHLISAGRAENAVQVTRTLQDNTNQSLSTESTRRYLKKAGMKAVVKKDKPLLTKRHRKERLDFAISHQHWTVEDWKRVVWSDETKINCVGSDGMKWAWKKSGEGLSDRLVNGTLKFGGGSLMMWVCMLWEGVDYA